MVYRNYFPILLIQLPTFFNYSNISAPTKVLFWLYIPLKGMSEKEITLSVCAIENKPFLGRNVVIFLGFSPSLDLVC